MYGGLRPGANLYGESVVAVDIRTGEYRWHFQTSHHPLWDYDLPTAPILVDAVKDGRTIKALAQATKQGLLFVLNRETGEPVWPIPEVAVPQGNVPGEWYSPTQPIPTIRYGHQGVAVGDLIDFTPALRAEAERVVAEHRIGPIYTPAVAYNPNGPVSTLMVMGGSNWPGGSFDPDTKMVYVTASVGVNSMTICRYAEGSVMPHGICLGPRRRRVRRLAQCQRAGSAAVEAAVRHDRGHRSHEGRGRVGDPERRDARQRQAITPRLPASRSAARAAQGSRRARSRRRRC